MAIRHRAGVAVKPQHHHYHRCNSSPDTPVTIYTISGIKVEMLLPAIFNGHCRSILIYKYCFYFTSQSYLNSFYNFAENLESMLNGMRPPLPTGNIKRESSSSSRAGQQNVGGANNSSGITDLDRSLSPPYTGSSNSNNLVS